MTGDAAGRASESLSWQWRHGVECNGWLIFPQEVRKWAGGGVTGPPLAPCCTDIAFFKEGLIGGGTSTAVIAISFPMTTRWANPQPDGLAGFSVLLRLQLPCISHSSRKMHTDTSAGEVSFTHTAVQCADRHALLQAPDRAGGRRRTGAPCDRTPHRHHHCVRFRYKTPRDTRHASGESHGWWWGPAGHTHQCSGRMGGPTALPFLA